MRGYWPQQLDDATGVTDHLNRVAKYVVSATLQDPEWEGTTILRGPLGDDIRALKSAEGSDIVVTGSIHSRTHYVEIRHDPGSSSPRRTIVVRRRSGVRDD